METHLAPALNSPRLAAAQKRALLVFGVALFPPLFTALVFVLVLLLGGIRFPPTLHPHSPFGEISQPGDRSTQKIGSRFTIAGSVGQLSDDEYLYLVEQRGKHYWPKKFLGNKPGDWEMQLTARDNKGKPSHYYLMKTDQLGKANFDQWFQQAYATGKYPPIANIDGMVSVARIKVLSQ